ncbi:E3 ubiquitin-protein ligase TTC3 [Frankliniella occidentalis]|uniref:E3 ubiquitin-protein ligase TTC3 n=1 Tax=Frankliniella occidentalis TaxID=133901 RepID=A0A9C6WWB6_FRAOC|nr:E3 ubiquitin-protein ligase TTC3 [Frankliniella occidentalis]
MSQKADQYKALGNNCIKNQDFTGAVKNYSLGLKLDPENPILYCNMAQAHLNMRDFVEAEKCAKKAIEHRSDYVKAYYRAAKGALGRHSVYDSMMFLAQGVQNCIAQDVEELFLMAKELSPEFENALRSFRDKEKSQANKKKGSASEPKEGEASNSKSSKKGGKSLKSSIMGSGGEKESKAGLAEQDKIQDEVNDIQKKLKNHQEKHKKLEEELERDTREKRRKLEEEEELLKNKLRELEEKKERDKKAQELNERERERLAEEQRERDRKDRERKAQELKELEKKESEEKARQAAQEKRDQELKEQKKKDLEKKERDKKERERKEAQRKLDLEKKAQELERLKTELQNQMKEGSLALLKGLHRKAIDSFSKAFDSINSNPSPKNLGIHDPMDIVILHFAFAQARIYSDEYSDIIKAVQQLEKMEKEGLHRKLPAIFLLLGKAFIRLNRYSHALYPLQRGLSFIERGTSFSNFAWPGTNEVIELTDKNCLQDALQSSVQTCKQYHKPDAICFYENCLSFNNQHILPSQNIFFSDPDFVGFIHIICQQLCHIYFHLPCWKDFKEKMSEVQKLNEKDFLGRDCLTPDCMIQNDKPAIIVKVITIGPDGEEKSSCECTPPPLTPSVLAKEREDIDKSPKKKQRKKQRANSTTSKVCVLLSLKIKIRWVEERNSQ